jgi:hypothetical protein
MQTEQNNPFIVGRAHFCANQSYVVWVDIKGNLWTYNEAVKKWEKFNSVTV